MILLKFIPYILVDASGWVVSDVSFGIILLKKCTENKKAEDSLWSEINGSITGIIRFSYV